MPDVTALNALMPDGSQLHVSGREAWALNELFRAGSNGLTPRERPAPRWSCYVQRLRKRGLDIETVHEPHAGAYAGRHGRYVLRTALSLVSVQVAGAEHGR